jgi:hypothetical protein
MKHNVVRSVLTILLAAVAVFDIAEGILVLTGVCTPAVKYQGTLFPDATVPMLLVAIVVGGSSLLAAATVFIRHAWSVFLAAAAGLIMIAWEVTEIVVVQQSSWLQLIFTAIGLAVIALAEYLWTTEFRGQQLKHNVIRIALVVIEGFIGLSAIQGGIGLLRGAYPVPVAWLAGTPFSDYTIPGLVLVIVVGGSALLAAATVFIHREWAVLVSVLAGLLMAGYEVVVAGGRSLVRGGAPDRPARLYGGTLRAFAHLPGLSPRHTHH